MHHLRTDVSESPALWLGSHLPIQTCLGPTGTATRGGLMGTLTPDCPTSSRDHSPMGDRITASDAVHTLTPGTRMSVTLLGKRGFAA